MPKDKRLTKREVWALKYLLDYPISRYLMSCSIQRIDPGERAQRHIEITEILCKFVFAEGEKYNNSTKVNDAWKPIHDYLADILTDRMDETIGFPLHTPLYGSEMYDPLVELFFNKIIINFANIEKIALKSIKTGGDSMRR
jgi:hypothetical protein